MARLRWLGAAVCAAAVASGAFFGASSLAATHATTHATHTNYRGPARQASVLPGTHHSNYRGPARTPARITVHGTNLPASARTSNRGAQR
jgi:hypothetical protein